MTFLDHSYGRRVFVGLCVAAHVPFVIAVIQATPFLLKAAVGAGESGFVTALIQALPLIGLIYFAFISASGITAMMFGLPLVLIYRRLGLEYWWSFVAGGAVVGVLGGAIYVYLSTSVSVPLSDMFFSRITAQAVISGALSALTFWYLVYRRGAPKRGP